MRRDQIGQQRPEGVPDGEYAMRVVVEYLTSDNYTTVLMMPLAIDYAPENKSDLQWYVNQWIDKLPEEGCTFVAVHYKGSPLYDGYATRVLSGSRSVARRNKENAPEGQKETP